MYPLRRSNTYGAYKRCGAFVCSRHCIAHDMPAQVAPDDLRQLIATVAAAPVLSSGRRRYIMLPAAVHRRSQALQRERTP